MANSNPVTDAPAEKKPAETKAAPKGSNPMDKFKTVLPNGLTVHNFVQVAE